MTSLDLTVITIARDRRDHLAAQAASLARQSEPAGRYIIVDMGGPEIGGLPHHPLTDLTITKLDTGEGLPLAAARNRGAELASSPNLLFLDVDCVAPDGALSAYNRHVTRRPNALHCGPVGYLDESGDHTRQAGARFPDDRPMPQQASERNARYEMFWSLAFATSQATFDYLGGFDDHFVGYGAEDTDFAFTARSREVPLWFHGHPVVYHLPHGPPGPPDDRLPEICRNAERFYAKWSCYPMVGWLDQLEADGRIQWDRPHGTVTPVHRSETPS